MKETAFLDYTIVEFASGLVLTDKAGKNAMPGAAIFDHLDKAKKAATMLFMITRPQHFSASLFWRFIGREGAMHEWYTLRNILREEKIEMPEELNRHYDGLNYLIGFNGESIKSL